MSILQGNSIEAGGYKIQKSLRLRRNAAASLTRVHANGLTNNSTKLTFSAWIKRGQLGLDQYLLSCYPTGGYASILGFLPNDVLTFYTTDASSNTMVATSTAVFRDPAAWYHLVLCIDTGNATPANRVRIWMNNQLVASASPSLNQRTMFFLGGGYTHAIGQYAGGYNADCAFSDVYLLEGVAADPTAFGINDGVTGQWIPKQYMGGYGAQGSFLPFKNGSSLTALGYDASGNNTHWTPANISLTAGATYDWLEDTPSTNYATLNTLDQQSTTVSAGSLDGAISTTRSVTATQSMTHGKYYWETGYIGQTSSALLIGVAGPTLSASTYAGYLGLSADSWAYYGNTGYKLTNSSAGIAYGNAYTATDVIGVAFDANTGSIWFSKNGVWQGGGDPVAGTGAAYTGLPSGCRPAWGNGTTGGGQSFSVNFGQRPFNYTPPTGFKTLCTANLLTPSIVNPKKHFDVITRSGTGTPITVSSFDFDPDFVWIKQRNGTAWHNLWDVVRGEKYELNSNSAIAEVFQNGNGHLTAFNSKGYTLNGGVNLNGVSQIYVDWAWKAGGAPVANTSGTIASRVSANPQAGFSIVSYTGSGSNGTIGHGLGAAPKVMFIKARTGVAREWVVYHGAMSSVADFILLSNTAAKQIDSAVLNGAPLSSVFNVGTSPNTNGLGIQHIAYCFAEILGYSKFGSYVGNGSVDGSFVYCGFRPRYIMTKRIDSTGDWLIHDTARDMNVAQLDLLASSSIAEQVNVRYDILSNGFKLREAGSNTNAAAGSYIFFAFAESPFQFANAR